jgi:hypothetical protein
MTSQIGKEYEDEDDNSVIINIVTIGFVPARDCTGLTPRCSTMQHQDKPNLIMHHKVKVDHSMVVQGDPRGAGQPGAGP